VLAFFAARTFFATAFVLAFALVIGIFGAFVVRACVFIRAVTARVGPRLFLGLGFVGLIPVFGLVASVAFVSRVCAARILLVGPLVVRALSSVVAVRVICFFRVVGISGGVVARLFLAAPGFLCVPCAGFIRIRPRVPARSRRRTLRRPGLR
jgi:hypothetical protein